MASLIKTYKGDLTTFIAGKIWEFVKNRAKKGSEDVEDEEPTKQSEQPSSVSSVTSIVPVRKEGTSGLSRNVDPKTEKITNIINNLNDVINNVSPWGTRTIEYAAQTSTDIEKMDLEKGCRERLSNPTLQHTKQTAC